MPLFLQHGDPFALAYPEAWGATMPTSLPFVPHQREIPKVAVTLSTGGSVLLGSEGNSELTRKIVEEFAPRFVPGGILVCAGDSEDELAYLNAKLLAELGVAAHGIEKMPDVVRYCPQKERLFLVESATSHGPVDGKRHKELARVFLRSKAGLIYVTAFPSRSAMASYEGDIDWGTEVWVADEPDHMIHFGGGRVPGPYSRAAPSGIKAPGASGP